MNEHAPLMGRRRGQGSFLCHRSSGGCTCEGNGKAKREDRRTQMRLERKRFRLELMMGAFAEAVAVAVKEERARGEVYTRLAQRARELGYLHAARSCAAHADEIEIQVLRVEAVVGL